MIASMVDTQVAEWWMELKYLGSFRTLTLNCLTGRIIVDAYMTGMLVTVGGRFFPKWS